jgi:hypothetical protein
MDCLARIETFVKLVETRGFTALQSPPGCMMAAGTDNETTNGDARRQFELHLRPHPQHHVVQLARPTRNAMDDDGRRQSGEADRLGSKCRIRVRFSLSTTNPSYVKR